MPSPTYDTTAWSPDLANIIIGKKMCVFVGGEQYSYYPRYTKIFVNAILLNFRIDYLF